MGQDFRRMDNCPFGRGDPAAGRGAALVRSCLERSRDRGRGGFSPRNCLPVTAPRASRPPICASTARTTPRRKSCCRRRRNQPARSGISVPSRWITLSVGRGNRAEPRWLLPLLCRAGNLDKSAIGAIRVQESETFVELSEASVEGFLSALGTGRLAGRGALGAPAGRCNPTCRRKRSAPRPDADKPRTPRPGGVTGKPRKAGTAHKADAAAGKPDSSHTAKTQTRPRAQIQTRLRAQIQPRGRDETAA